VHSNEQIIASPASGARSFPHLSQFGRSSSIATAYYDQSSAGDGESVGGDVRRAPGRPTGIGRRRDELPRKTAAYGML